MVYCPNVPEPEAALVKKRSHREARESTPIVIVYCLIISGMESTDKADTHRLTRSRYLLDGAVFDDISGREDI